MENIDLATILTDELVDMRENARKEKNYRLSDQIRNELDSRGSFVIDSPNGQVIYHLGHGYTRENVLTNIRDINARFR